MEVKHMEINNILHNNETVSDLHAKAAALQIERFCKQMPYGKYMLGDNRYEAHNCIGLGYTIGGEIVAIPDFTKIEGVVRNIRSRMQMIDTLQQVNRDDARAEVYALYESADFLRLDDGSLVGIKQGLQHDYFYIPVRSDMDTGFSSFRIESILSNYNAYMTTIHPNWVIHTVGWFDIKSK